MFTRVATTRQLHATIRGRVTTLHHGATTASEAIILATGLVMAGAPIMAEGGGAVRAVDNGGGLF